MKIDNLRRGKSFWKLIIYVLKFLKIKQKSWKIKFFQKVGKKRVGELGEDKKYKK